MRILRLTGKQDFPDDHAHWRIRILRRINRLALMNYITEQERRELQELVVPDLFIDRKEPRPSCFTHSPKRGA